MKKISFLIAALFAAVYLQAQPLPQEVKMKQFIDELMSKMTLEEKIGQLNLPGAGDFTTGQTASTDIGKKIIEGKVGGLFNISTVAKIRSVQQVAVEKSRLKIPLIFGMDVKIGRAHV